MSWPSGPAVTAAPKVSPAGAKGRNTMPTSSHRPLQPLLGAHPEDTQVNPQDPGPDSWGTYQRNDFNKPRPLHLPNLEKD